MLRLTGTRVPAQRPDLPHLPTTVSLSPAGSICLCVYFRILLPKHYGPLSPGHQEAPPLLVLEGLSWLALQDPDDKNTLTQRLEVGKGIGFRGSPGLEGQSERT